MASRQIHLLILKYNFEPTQSLSLNLLIPKSLIKYFRNETSYFFFLNENSEYSDGERSDYHSYHKKEVCHMFFHMTG